MKANISMIIEQNISACNELHDIYFLFFRYGFKTGGQNGAKERNVGEEAA